jgi:hypothetical protein
LVRDRATLGRPSSKDIPELAIANLTALSWRPQYRTSNTPPHRERTPGSARRNSTEASSPRPPRLSGCDVHGREPPLEPHRLDRILGCPRSGSNGTNTSRSVAAGRQDTRSPATHWVIGSTRHPQLSDHRGVSVGGQQLQMATSRAAPSRPCRWPIRGYGPSDRIPQHPNRYRFFGHMVLPNVWVAVTLVLSSRSGRGT